jgi:hypothetical protein
MIIASHLLGIRAVAVMVEKIYLLIHLLPDEKSIIQLLLLLIPQINLGCHSALLTQVHPDEFKACLYLLSFFSMFCWTFLSLPQHILSIFHSHKFLLRKSATCAISFSVWINDWFFIGLPAITLTVSGGNSFSLKSLSFRY